VARRNRQGVELLGPFIAARRKEKKEDRTENFVRRFLSIWLENSPSFDRMTS
jgi:hypothetical protein